MRKGQLSTRSTHSKNPVELWGLTGGVASGKSAAAGFFAEFGIPVIDADQIVRELSAPGGAAHKLLVERFGTAERKEIRELVFQDPAARKDLEAIIHPLVQAETLNRIQLLAGFHPGKRIPVIYEAALLVETGRYQSMDGLIVVDCPREVRKARLIARSGHSPELAEQILNSQASEEERRAAATYLLQNSGSLEQLREGVKRFISERGWLK